jgi:hypothetical protein
MMRQYCRYCVNLNVNNVPYCSAKDEIRTESSCKRTNNCKDFVYCDAEPEYQDAFGETGGYKPRVRKPKPKPDVEVNQLSLDFGKERDPKGYAPATELWKRVVEAWNRR